MQGIAMNKSLIFAIIAGTIIAYGAFAVDDPIVGDKTTTSQPYVKTQVDLKQGKIPAAGTNSALGESVVMYTANGGGEIGERALFTGASDYNASEDADKLITASALKKALTLPETDTTTLECANPSDGCTLWTIVDQTAYGETITLPAGYTRLEYIQSTGTQYIDTGVKGNLNTRAELDFKFSAYTPTSGEKYGNMLGFRTDQNQQAFLCGTTNGYINEGTKLFCQFDTVTPTILQDAFIDLNRHVLTLSKDGFYIDNISYRTYPNATTFTTTKNITLFAYFSSSNFSYGKFIAYSFKLWDGNTLVRNFVPAKDSNNEIGMYDTVSGQFFRNQGSGSFTAGPVVQ